MTDKHDMDIIASSLLTTNNASLQHMDALIVAMERIVAREPWENASGEVLYYTPERILRSFLPLARALRERMADGWFNDEIAERSIQLAIKQHGQLLGDLFVKSDDIHGDTEMEKRFVAQRFIRAIASTVLSALPTPPAPEKPS